MKKKQSKTIERKKYERKIITKYKSTTKIGFA